ncbi:unnamed protein product [Rotaria sp. Silwood1]|nr:unnamed protein product [Rotaria sp. Silwood1]
MSSSTADIIVSVSQQYTICVSFIILFTGILGHMLNIFVLTHLKIFQGNPSAFYLIVESIVNLLQMMISFTSRIAINGFANDLTQTSLVWCKLRQLFVQYFTLVSLTIGSFYLFLISSARFRRQVKHVLINKCWRTYCKKTTRHNQVAAVTQWSSSEYDLRSVQ